MTDLFLDPSDAELLQRYRDGDDDAAGLLFERHHPAAVRLAGALAGASAAEDLASDAFVAVLRAVRNGAGPQFAFRPYLLTSVRNGFYAASRAASRQDLYDDLEASPDAPTVADGTALREESSLLAQAFATLPERWQAVLWHTTIHDESPEQVGQVLGIKPNAVSSLALRAREGLRNAYLTAHLGQTDDPECREVRELLPAYDRGRLRPRAHARVEAHLDVCDDCREAAALVGGITADLGILLLPALLGAPGVAAFGGTRVHAVVADGTHGAQGSGAAGTGSATLGVAETAGAIAVGVAAVAVLVTVAAVGASRLGPPDDATTPSAAATSAPRSTSSPRTDDRTDPTPEPFRAPLVAPLTVVAPVLASALPVPVVVPPAEPSAPTPTTPTSPAPTPPAPTTPPPTTTPPVEVGEDLSVSVLEAVPGDVYEVTLAVTSPTLTPQLQVELPAGTEVSLWGGEGWTCTGVGTVGSCQASGPNPQPIRFWWSPGEPVGFSATVSAPDNVDPNPANDSVSLG
ncbi:sigma-70 family RNA polymerase sigma factor [Aeromicrobium sp.]|uniref:sigma-70 family RNA polymerase sigma factor n=1 Tax=Aeromicrobium sp. TaxID=1871063 RepID=UPI00403383F7